MDIPTHTPAPKALSCFSFPFFPVLIISPGGEKKRSAGGGEE
jgi:hypothetical protein